MEGLWREQGRGEYGEKTGGERKRKEVRGEERRKEGKGLVGRGKDPKRSKAGLIIQSYFNEINPQV